MSGKFRPTHKLWGPVRLQVLERDGYRCQKCGKAGRLEVDHVTPLDLGGAMYKTENLQALCRNCHFEKTAQENRNEPTESEEGWQRLIAELL